MRQQEPAAERGLEGSTKRDCRGVMLPAVEPDDHRLLLDRTRIVRRMADRTLAVPIGGCGPSVWTPSSFMASACQLALAEVIGGGARCPVGKYGFDIDDASPSCRPGTPTRCAMNRM